MFENIRLSFQGIWSHKMRSFLTMLGIIIGIASIISIVSTIKGTNEQIKENLIGAGNNTVQIKLYQGGSPYYTEYNGLPSGITPISKETMEAIHEIEHVDNASMYLVRENADSVYRNSTVYSGSIYGIDANYFDTCGYVIKQGRGFSSKDFSNYRKVIVLDSSAAEALFASENPIGKTIEVLGEPFTVIGICEKSSSFQPVINSIDDYYNYVGNVMSSIYIPLSSWTIPYGYDEPEKVVIKATATDYMSSVGKAAEKILNDANGIVTASADTSVAEVQDNSDSMKITYTAIDLSERAENLQKLSQATNQQLLWIASISLLVGGIGVMNIMLVSVTERTSEIGLKKAIGARNSVILGQFLTEAAVLTSFGGILGVIAGIGLAQIISSISSAPVSISIGYIIASVVFSMVIGIIFGLLPSVKASRLNPIDALRHE